MLIGIAATTGNCYNIEIQKQKLRVVKMIIREYQIADCKEITELFYNIVHTVNAKDYTKEQLEVWAPKEVDLEKWNQTLQEHYSIVAIENEIIVGFGDIDKTGYLDHLFVHTDYQRKGIATVICNQLEQTVQGILSLTLLLQQNHFLKKEVIKYLKNSMLNDKEFSLRISV